MNHLLLFCVFAVTSAVKHTAAPPLAESEQLTKNHPTFSPGAFTHKLTLTPLHHKTIAPLELDFTKRPHPSRSHGTKSPLVLANKFPSSGTKRPPVEAAASRKPHGTRPPKHELGKGTFAPGAFTHKFTLPPLHKKTFAPLDLAASKKPHGTNYPPEEELYRHGRSTVAPAELSATDVVTKKDKGSFITKKPHSTNAPK